MRHTQGGGGEKKRAKPLQNLGAGGGGGGEGLGPIARMELLGGADGMEACGGGAPWGWLC